MPDISTIADGVALGKSIFDFLRFLRSTAGADVISAYFDDAGSRIEGSEQIEVEIEYPSDEKTGPVFFYRVKPVPGYVFVRYPAIESCALEVLGILVGEKQPTAEYWRWIAPVLPGRIYGGGYPPNVKVSFLVFGSNRVRYSSNSLLGVEGWRGLGDTSCPQGSRFWQRPLCLGITVMPLDLSVNTDALRRPCAARTPGASRGYLHVKGKKCARPDYS